LRFEDLPRARADVVARGYRLHSPDVVALRVAGRPNWTGLHESQPNGCIDLEGVDPVAIEHLTPIEASTAIHRASHSELGAIQLEVAEFRSQRLYLFGEVTGWQRAVPYQGPENVVDVLKRAGGITQLGQAHHIRIVRNPLLDRTEPERLEVDLEQILLHGDHRTNHIVQPFDEIYVPESHQAKVEKCLHPLFRPLGCVFGPVQFDEPQVVVGAKPH
jgi:protein involved in polysaccharide export with SLBB domain